MSYNTSLGEVGTAGVRINAVLKPLTRLRTAGEAGGYGERVPVGGGHVDSATQAAVAFSINYPPGVERDPNTPEYPVVTAALDSLPLRLPNGVSLADAADVLGLFGYGMKQGDTQASLRVHDRATVFVDSSVTAGQALFVQFPEPGEDMSSYPRAENGVFVPKVVARSRMIGSEETLKTIARAANTASSQSPVAAAMNEFQTGMMSFCYAMAARALAALEGPSVGSIEDADRTLASSAFQASTRGKALKDLARAFGMEGSADPSVAQVVEMTFKEMCSNQTARKTGDPVMDNARQMAIPRVVNGLSYVGAHSNRHFIGTATMNCPLTPGHRGRCELLLSTY